MKKELKAKIAESYCKVLTFLKSGKIGMGKTLLEEMRTSFIRGGIPQDFITRINWLISQLTNGNREPVIAFIESEIVA